MISVSIKERFRNICRVRKSDEKVHYSQKPVDFLRENRLYRKFILILTYRGLKTLRQVYLYLSDLEMNWTSSFVIQSDKLAIVQHLLLAPVGTVAKQAEHKVAHCLWPIPEAVSRCFPLNCTSTL